LTMLDGASVDVPGFDLVVRTHPEDEKYLRDNGENWWPNGVAVDVSHENWHPYLRKVLK
jgi:hypothetical protein